MKFYDGMMPPRRPVVTASASAPAIRPVVLDEDDADTASVERVLQLARDAEHGPALSFEEIRHLRFFAGSEE